MALTSNKNIQVRNLSVASYDSLPVLASSTVYQSALVALDSSGYAAHASDSASLTGAGVAVSYADNSTGQSGDVSVNVYTSGEIALQTSGSVAYGDPVYVASDVKVAASGSLAVNGVFVGHAMEEHEDLAGYRWIRLDGPKKTGYPTV